MINERSPVTLALAEIKAESESRHWKSKRCRFCILNVKRLLMVWILWAYLVVNYKTSFQIQFFFPVFCDSKIQKLLTWSNSQKKNSKGHNYLFIMVLYSYLLKNWENNKNQFVSRNFVWYYMECVFVSRNFSAILWYFSLVISFTKIMKKTYFIHNAYEWYA